MKFDGAGHFGPYVTKFSLEDDTSTTNNVGEFTLKALDEEGNQVQGEVFVMVKVYGPDADSAHPTGALAVVSGGKGNVIGSVIGIHTGYTEDDFTLTEDTPNTLATAGRWYLCTTSGDGELNLQITDTAEINDNVKIICPKAVVPFQYWEDAFDYA